MYVMFTLGTCPRRMIILNTEVQYMNYLLVNSFVNIPKYCVYGILPY